MNDISYSYEIIRVDPSVNAMEVIFRSPGLPPMNVGTRMPHEGESLDVLMAQYAPIYFWSEINRTFVNPGVGTSGSYTPPAPPTVTLESAKADKLKEIADWRWKRETSGIPINGSTIDTSRESQALITGAFLGIKEGLIQSVDFKTLGGTWKSFSLPEITVIAGLVAQHVQECFTREKELTDRVVAATTLEEVAAIDPTTSFLGNFGAIPSTGV